MLVLNVFDQSLVHGNIWIWHDAGSVPRASDGARHLSADPRSLLTRGERNVSSADSVGNATHISVDAHAARQYRTIVSDTACRNLEMYLSMSPAYPSNLNRLQRGVVGIKTQRELENITRGGIADQLSLSTDDLFRRFVGLSMGYRHDECRVRSGRRDGLL